MKRSFFSSAIAVLICAGCAAGGDDLPAGEKWLKPVQTIELPGVEGRIDHFAFDERGERLFMAALGSDSVEVIDVKGANVVEQIKGLATPQGVAFAANRLAVANDKDGSCRIYDGSTLKEIGRVDLKDDADNVRFDSALKRFWVGYGDGALASIDPEKVQKTGEIKLDGHPESFQLESKGARIFVNVPRAGHVVVVDRRKGTVIDKWTLKEAQANFPMALDETNRRIFVGCRKPARLVVLDMDTGKQIAAVDCVEDTDDLFYDAAVKRIYICGGEGAVDVVEQTDADHYRRIGRVKTAAGARTAWFAASQRRLYVAVPHRGAQRAELRVFQAAEN